MNSEQGSELVFNPKLNPSMLFYRREKLVDSNLVLGVSALINGLIILPSLILNFSVDREEIVVILFFTIFLFAPLIYFFFAFKEFKNFKYVVDSDSIQVITDYLDRGYEGTSFDNISNIKLNIRFLQRYFNVGDIILETPGSDENNIKLSHLENPEEVYDTLSKKVEETEYSQPSKGVKSNE